MGRSRKLRLRARRSGRRLRVSVIAPASERGSVTVRLARRRGKRLHVLARHKARPRHSRARTVFVLATQDRHARVLVVIASAHGAMPSRLRVVLRKRS